MTIKLDHFVDKKVDITLRNGFHFEDVIVRKCISTGQFKLQLKTTEVTRRRDGSCPGFTLRSGHDIVSIKLSLSKKERLEQKIVTLEQELTNAKEELGKLNNITFTRAEVQTIRTIITEILPPMSSSDGRMYLNHILDLIDNKLNS